MYKLHILLLCFMAGWFIVFSGGCEQESDVNFEESNNSDKISEEANVLAPIGFLEQDWFDFWRLSQEQQTLEQYMISELDRLNKSGEEGELLNVQITDLHNTNWEFDLSFKTNTNWSMNALFADDVIAQLSTIDNGDIQADMGDDVHLYATGAFDFLFPLTHIHVISEALRNESFSRLTWTKKEAFIHIHLDTSAKLVEDLFHTYLSAHVQDDLDQLHLDGYDLQYELVLEMDTHMQYDSIYCLEFRLTSEERTLEHLHYQF